MKFFSKKRYLILPLLATAAIIILIKPPYLVKQGYYLFKYYFSGEKISHLLKDEKISPDEKQLFTRIARIKNHAINEFGLSDNNNYTRYVSIKRNFINYVVSAADPLSLTPKKWHFPIFGDFPYLGFFTGDEALEEAKKLNTEGLDVYIRTAGAFSTLGILSDPVYSYFSRYTYFSLARLIIHEQTHATLYLENQIRFNEELATFVGRVGSLHYLEKNYGSNSRHYRDALKQIRTTEEIYDFFRSFHEDLKKLYEGPLDTGKKLSRKKKLFAGAKDKFLKRFKSRLKKDSFTWYQKQSWNNAFVLSFIRYGKDLSLFYRLYQLKGNNLKKMLESLKKLETIETDPKIYIRGMLSDERTSQ